MILVVTEHNSPNSFDSVMKGCTIDGSWGARSNTRREQTASYSRTQLLPSKAGGNLVLERYALVRRSPGRYDLPSGVYPTHRTPVAFV